jgi:phage terminase large subunit-like protein
MSLRSSSAGRGELPGLGYALDVTEGRLPASKLTRLVCDRYLRDLEEGPKRGLTFDADRAQRAIGFFPFLRHSKGEWSGTPFGLSPWQEMITANLFGWRRSDGTRRFRRAHIEIPRKNGKTTWLAGTGLYLLLPDGEPGAEVYSAATKRDQARISFSEAGRMVRASPGLRARIRVNRDSLVIPGTAAKFEPLGADSNTLDGLNVHGGLIDELHKHRTRDVFDVLDTATGSRRQPLLISITTAGDRLESICWQEHAYAVKVLERGIDADEFFTYISTIDEGDDWRDEESWLKANPNLGISVKLDDLREAASKAIASPAAEAAFRRYRLNEWLQRVLRWLSMDAWLSCNPSPSPDELIGQPCFGGLDMSNSFDLTAFVLFFPLQKAALSWFWLPEEQMAVRVNRDRVPYDAWVREGLISTTPGNVIDAEHVRNRIVEISRRYRVLRVGFDPRFSIETAIRLGQEGIEMVAHGQGMSRMTPPSKRLEELVATRELAHGYNPVLNWMASNVVVERDAQEQMRPSKGKSTERIDGISGLVMAIGTWMLYDKPIEPGSPGPVPFATAGATRESLSIFE